MRSAKSCVAALSVRKSRVEANGRPGVLISHDGTDVALLTIEALPEGINTLLWVMNPVKLKAFARSRSTRK